MSKQRITSEKYNGPERREDFPSQTYRLMCSQRFEEIHKDIAEIKSSMWKWAGIIGTFMLIVGGALFMQGEGTRQMLHDHQENTRGSVQADVRPDDLPEEYRNSPLGMLHDVGALDSWGDYGEVVGAEEDPHLVRQSDGDRGTLQEERSVN